MKEFHITADALPGITFTVRADSYEKAVKKLIPDVQAFIAELQKAKGQSKKQNTTA